MNFSDKRQLKAAMENGKRLDTHIKRLIQEDRTMRNLKLFVVKNRSNGAFYMEGDLPAYFNDKMLAKKVRDTLPGGKEDWKVSKGPDHRLYNDDEE